MKVYRVRLSKELIERLLSDGALHRSVRIDRGVPAGYELRAARYEPPWPGGAAELTLEFRPIGPAAEVVELLPGFTYTDIAEEPKA